MTNVKNQQNGKQSGATAERLSASIANNAYSPPIFNAVFSKA